MAFIIIMDMLESKMVADPPTTQSLVASAMYSKLTDYWVHLDKSSTISAIIDPSHKLDTFYENIDDIRKTFEDKYKSYSSITTLPSEAILIKEDSSRRYFRKKLKVSKNNNTTDILNSYLNIPEEDIDPLIWYKAREVDPKYGTLALMAKDYLSIQTTSVPSEQAFSIAKNTISLIRNRLDPEKARASLCLKSWLDNGMIKLKDLM
jgi:hypothetical protein